MFGIRQPRGIVLAIVASTGLLGACGGSPSRSEPPAGPSTPRVESSSPAPSATVASPPTGPIIGRWVQVHRCETLVSALEAAGLGETAPAVIGDYFPDEAPEALAAKRDVCAGAEPQRHFHFFDENGWFGSLDQNEQTVDGNDYELVGDDRLRIGGVTWRYAIEGDRLSLEPLITDEQRAEAIADPMGFTPATWAVAVAYPGTTWKRVACDVWC